MLPDSLVLFLKISRLCKRPNAEPASEEVLNNLRCIVAIGRMPPLNQPLMNGVHLIPALIFH